MKYFILVCFLIGCAVAHQNFSEEEKAEYKKYKTECIDATHVDADVVKKAKHEGVFPEDEKLKEYYVCLFKKFHFLNDAGDLQKDVVKAKLVKKYGEEAAEKVFNACADKKHSDIKETAFLLAKCCYEHSPKHTHEKEH